MVNHVRKHLALWYACQQTWKRSHLSIFIKLLVLFKILDVAFTLHVSISGSCLLIANDGTNFSYETNTQRLLMFDFWFPFSNFSVFPEGKQICSIEGCLPLGLTDPTIVCIVL